MKHWLAKTNKRKEGKTKDGQRNWGKPGMMPRSEEDRVIQIEDKKKSWQHASGRDFFFFLFL